MADELAAIANTHDGVLVLGVDDKTRDITGIPLERLEAVERYVFEICNESIKPPILFRSFRMQLPDNKGDLQPVLKWRSLEVFLFIKVPEVIIFGKEVQKERCHQNIWLDYFSKEARLVLLDLMSNQCHNLA